MEGKELLFCFVLFCFLSLTKNIFGASAGSGLEGRVMDQSEARGSARALFTAVV